MKKKPIIFLGSALAIALLLFAFGRTTEVKKPHAEFPAPTSRTAFSMGQYLDSMQNKLPASQSAQVGSLRQLSEAENTNDKKMEGYNRLAAFWKDSARNFLPYAYYISEAAKLDNSEKNLTFAAQLILEGMRGEHDERILAWETSTAIELFEKALQKNPKSADLRIGLGSAYIFGTGRGGDPQETMKGIQSVLSVVREDSTNMKAQFVLGVGGFVSGQYDKAIDRFTKVIAVQPNNLEAVAFLADAYAASGDKTNAVKWYEVSKRLAANPDYTREVNKRIEQLK